MSLTARMPPARQRCALPLSVIAPVLIQRLTRALAALTGWIAGPTLAHALALGALILIGALAGVSLPGCMSDLDRKQLAVRQEFHHSTKALIAAGGAFADGADEIADKKHTLQQKAIDAEWDAWLVRHTDEFGRLVSRDEASGELQPMPVVQLLAAQKLRETAIVQLHASKQSWQEFRDRWRAALAKFDAVNEMLAQQEVAVAEAKESAAAAFDAALHVLAGAAAGVGIGAGL